MCDTFYIFSILYSSIGSGIGKKKTVIRNAAVFKIWFISAKQNLALFFKCKTCLYGIVNIVNSF